MNLEIKKHLRREVKLLKECIISQELEIGKHNKEIQRIEKEIKSYRTQLRDLCRGLRKEDRKEIGFDY